MYSFTRLKMVILTNVVMCLTRVTCAYVTFKTHFPICGFNPIPNMPLDTTIIRMVIPIPFHCQNHIIVNQPQQSKWPWKTSTNKLKGKENISKHSKVNEFNVICNQTLQSFPSKKTTSIQIVICKKISTEKLCNLHLLSVEPTRKVLPQ